MGLTKACGNKATPPRMVASRPARCANLGRWSKRLTNARIRGSSVPISASEDEASPLALGPQLTTAAAENSGDCVPCDQGHFGRGVKPPKAVCDTPSRDKGQRAMLRHNRPRLPRSLPD